MPTLTKSKFIQDAESRLRDALGLVDEPTELQVPGVSSGTFSIALGPAEEKQQTPKEFRNEFRTRYIESKIEQARADLSFKERMHDSGSRFVRGIAGMLASVPEFAGATLEIPIRNMATTGIFLQLERRDRKKLKDLGRQIVSAYDADIPDDLDLDVKDAFLFQQGERFRAYIEKHFPTNALLADTLLADLSEGIGSTVAFAAGGLAAKALKIPSLVGIGVLGSTAEGVSLFRQAKMKGADDEKALLAGLFGIPIGATELLPFARLFKRLNRSTGGGLAKGIIRTLNVTKAQSFDEAFQELFQSTAGQEVMARMFAQERDLIASLRAMGIGGIIGAIVGGGGAVVTEFTGRAQDFRTELEDAGMAAVQAAPVPPDVTQGAETLPSPAEAPVAPATQPKVPPETPPVPEPIPRDPTEAKQFILTPPGARAIVIAEPELAAQIAAKESPTSSRQRFGAKGKPRPLSPLGQLQRTVPRETLDRMDRTERANFSRLLREAIAEREAATQKPAAVTEAVAGEPKAVPEAAKVATATAPELTLKEATRQVEAIRDKYRDLIEPEVVQPADTRTEDVLRSSYAFKKNKANESFVREVRDRLPENLQSKVTLVGKGHKSYSSADGADVFAEIGAEAMAEAVIAAKEGRVPKKVGLDRTATFVEENTNFFTPKEVQAAKNYQQIVAGEEVFPFGANQPSEPSAEAAVPPVLQQQAEEVLVAEQGAGRISLPVAEAAQAATKIEGLRAFARTPDVPRREPAGYWPSEEVAQRVKKSRGFKAEGFVVRLKELAVVAYRKSTRSAEFLPPKEFGSAHEGVRLLKAIPQMVTDEATRRIGSMIQGLNPADLGIYSDYLIVRNQLASLSRGEPLRFGFESQQQVEETRSRIEELLEDRPSVKDAVETRFRVNDELVKELQKTNLLSEHAEAEDYFHQQVLMYVNAAEIKARGAKPGKIKRAFQRARVKGESLPEEFDYNTSFVESEMTWTIDALVELQKERIYQDFFVRIYDVKRELLNRAKEQGTDDWAQFIPEGFDVFQPETGNIFYPATTIPEKLAEMLEQGELKAEDLKPEMLRKVVVLGGPKRQIVIPTAVAQQLRSMQKGKLSGPIGHASALLTNSWKAWTLLNPKRFIAYNIRNFTGDADPLLAAAIPTIGNVTKSSSELWKYYHNQEIAITDELRLARDLGVIGSSLTGTEIPESLSDLTTFQRFHEPGFDINKASPGLVSRYFQFIRRYTKLREDMLRYAVFLKYREVLKRGALTHYGASRKVVVDDLLANHGIDVTAAKLSRDLIGDYQDITILGDWLRSHALPFWSFQEINIKRYPRIAINALKAGDVKRATGATALLLFRTITLSRIIALYSAQWAWNNLLRPDEEDDLGRWDRQNPHANLGRLEDGNVRVFRNIGALGEFAEWFGINTLLSLLPRIEEGQLTVEDVLVEMAKDPINKLFQAVRPDAKAMFEVPMQISTFPDVLNPRFQDRGEGIASIFGLVDEYRAAKGALLKQGDRARPHYVQRIFTGIIDPRSQALGEILQLRSEFLEKKGRPEPTILAESLFTPLRRAAVQNDEEAFKEALKPYLRTGRGRKEFFLSLHRLDPISQKLNRRDEIEFEQQFLNGTQRKRLHVAREYAYELALRLSEWFRRDSSAIFAEVKEEQAEAESR